MENKPIIKRIGGYLYKMIPTVDSAGKVIQHTITPFMVELKPRDILQIIVGATILAIPVGLTEETWILGRELPMRNILLLSAVSILFLSTFIYFNFYRFYLKEHMFEYVKRVIATYALSLIVVGTLLTIIQKCPWGADNLLAIKRVIITAFPASMSAVISDSLK
ncbi:DUF2391 family protein [Candidatus Omnitrophota bacterium]